MNMLGNFILKQRKKRNLSQDFLASELGVSRPTYAQFEQDEKDLTLSEARKLADIFGIEFNNFLQGEDSPVVVKIEKEKKQAKEKSMEVRINIPQKNLKKFKEVFLYVLSKIGSKTNVGESVINKLFYFIDFDYYEKYEEQILGATYIKNHYGPTPVMFAKALTKMKEKNEIEEIKSKFFKYDQTKYIVNPKREPDLSNFSAQEIKHIDDELERLSDMTASELKDYSHKDIPWLTAEDGKPLDYESVFYRTDETSAREYDDKN